MLTQDASISFAACISHHSYTIHALLPMY